MRKRIAIGVSIPVVILFVGILIALLVPSNIFILTQALDGFGLLGGRRRIAGLVEAPPGHRPAPPLRIVNGMVWDAAGGLRPNPGLAITGGQFVMEAPPGASTIDAEGLTVLPGLIDMHVHALGGRFDGEMMIGRGVTTARDVGSHLSGILERRRETERGDRIGPRLFVTGPYLIGAGATSDQEIETLTPAAAGQVVDRFADAGVDGIKVHWGIQPVVFEAIVAAARRRGLWVAVHLDRLDARQAARAGADTIEHAWDVAGESDAGEIIGMLAASGVRLTPTLVVAEHAFRMPELTRDDNPMLEYFPRLARRFWISSQTMNAAAAGMGAEEIDRRRRRLDRLKRFVGRFHRAGGRVLAGTDAPAFMVAPGFDLHRELELLVASGLSPADALIAATSEAATALGRAAELGGLAPGMRGDALLVRGDPLAPGGTRRIVMVVKDGHVLFDRREVTEVE